jgi:hypothetical protein
LTKQNGVPVERADYSAIPTEFFQMADASLLVRERLEQFGYGVEVCVNHGMAYLLSSWIMP